MGLQSLYVINKAGSLIFHREFGGKPRLDSNDYIRLASTFHSFYIISGQINPTGTRPPSSTSCSIGGGIQTIDTSTFRLQCFQSPTGVKFFLTSSDLLPVSAASSVSPSPSSGGLSAGPVALTSAASMPNLSVAAPLLGGGGGAGGSIATSSDSIGSAASSMPPASGVAAQGGGQGAAGAQSRSDLEEALAMVFEMYSDYVMKNPFYELDQPIRNCEKFEQALDAAFASKIPSSSSTTASSSVRRAMGPL